MSLKDKFKKASKEVKERVEYIRGDKGILEQKYQETKKISPEDKLGEFRRIAVLGGIDLAWFLFCLGKFAGKDLKTIFVDNKIIDKWNKENENKKVKDTDSRFKQWLNKLQRTYPKTSARLKLWMLYSLVATMVAGGIKLTERDANENTKDSKIENVIDSDERETNGDNIEINDATKDIVKYDITDENFPEKFVDNNWNDIVISVLEFETWYDKAKLQQNESRYTHSAGLTWFYTEEKGKVTQHACQESYVNKADNLTMNQRWEQIRLHCLYKNEVMDKIKKEFNKYGFSTVTDQQILGLFVAGYQLPSRLGDCYKKNGNLLCTGIIHRLKDAGSDTQKQVDAFIAGTEVREKDRTGTNKRRWWCAMIYMGYITVDDLINMDRDAFSAIKINTIFKNNHFVYDAATIEYVLEQAKKPSNGSVKQFIEKRNVPLKGVIVKHQKSKIENNANNLSMAKTLDGLKAFKSKDYKKGIKCYKEAISLDENNMEAYASLALAYKKLGDETHSLDDYENVLKTVNACNAQMNKNRNLLHDPDVKAATYYNAGLAREEMAKLYEKSNKTNEAIECYNKAKSNFSTAYENAKEAENTDRMDVYKDSQKRIDNALKVLKAKDIKKKTNSFKTGKNKVSNKSAKTVLRSKNR